MTKMHRQSLVAYGEPLCETIVDCPTPRGSEVLVRVERCGVCHSDLHLQDGYFALGNDKRLDITKDRPLPFTLGHEIAGVIEVRDQMPKAPPSAPALRSIPGSAAAPARPAGPARRTCAPPIIISASAPTAALPATFSSRIRDIFLITRRFLPRWRAR